MRESELILKAKKHIHELGGAAIKYHGSPFSEKGIPDLLCVLRGRFVAAEAKTKTGKLSLMQVMQIERLRRAGALAFTYRTIEEFKSIVSQLVDNSSVK